MRPILLLVSLAACGGSREAPPVRVAAAADLSSAFADVGTAFTRATGQPVVFSFGSSGLLSRQLAEGAPFDVFAAADASYADAAVVAGACDGATRAPYARGRLAVWTARAPVDLAGLADPRYRRIAIANPEHAPYGRAAKEALLSAGLWEALAPRLVHGENVRQALQLAESGNAEAAIVAYPLVLGRPGAAVLVPAGLHRPLVQTLVACRRGARAEGGRAFAAFVASPAGLEILLRHGFEAP